MKKILSITLILAMALSMLVLSACGKTSEPAAPAAAPDAEPAAAPAAEPEAPAGWSEKDIYAKYAGTELNFIRHSGYEADWMTEKAEEFYQLSGIKVNVEQIAYSEMKNKVLLDISSDGGAYDIIATTEYWLSEFNEGDWLADQYQFINDPALYNPDFAVEDIAQSFLDANSVDGKLLALPFKFNSQLLCYRTDLVDTPPTTWDEMLSAAERYTKDGMIGVSMAFSLNSIMDVYLNTLYQAGGTFLNETNTACNLDSKEAADALDYLIKLSAFTSEGAANNQWPESAALFQQEQAAMVMSINSQLSNMVNPEISNVVDKIGYAELPGGVACLSTWGLAITNNCECPEAAWLFLQYMFSPEKTEELVIGTKGADIPVRSELLLSDTLSQFAHFETMNKITSQEGHTWVYPKTTCTTAIMESLAIHVQNAIIGAEEPAAALATAKAEIDALLAN